MPKVEYSDSFAADLAAVTSPRVEAHILTALDCIEQFGEFGSSVVSESIRRRFGNVRKVVVSPFDLLYTYYPEDDLVRIEALVRQRGVV